MSRASEPSARVAEILEEDRPRRPLELPPTLATGRYVVGRQAVLGVALVVALAVGIWLLNGRDPGTATDPGSVRVVLVATAREEKCDHAGNQE